MHANLIIFTAIMIVWAFVAAAAIRRAASAAKTPPTPSTNTEFCAEVVRILNILPHSNADKLELAHFEMSTGPASYEVVVQKGTYKIGDLAAYLSVDCLVPVSHPQFAFLKKGDATHHRLRAARLRGVFSQGLLVAAPARARLGDSVAEAYGVTYHGAGEEQLEPGVKTKPSSAPQCLPIYGVESLKKSPNLFSEGETVAITEKIHGCNFRFGWVRKRVMGVRVGWRFVVGSHRTMKDTDTEHTNDLWLEVAHRKGLASRTRNYKGLAFYAEIFGMTEGGKKIQDLTYGLTTPAFMVFDVRRQDGSWLAFQERCDLLNDLGMQHVPVIEIGGWSRNMTALAEGKSKVAPEQIREGIVVESIEGPRRKAKYVGQGYLLRKETA